MSQQGCGCSQEDEQHWVWVAGCVWGLGSAPCSPDIPNTDPAEGGARGSHVHTEGSHPPLERVLLTGPQRPI